MKLYIIAGEASGDHYGAKIIEKFKATTENLHVRFWGGDQMLDQDSNIAMHIKETAFMGFLEVVQNLGTIRKHFQYCKSDILAFNPDLILFIDYPGFNLRIAKWAKSKSYQTAYFIPPKVWAWKESRVEKLRKYLDHVIVIFPFEQPYYASKEMTVQYFGNPLQEDIDLFKKNNLVIRDKKLIALMPGSRKQELDRHLSVMVDIARNKPKESFCIIVAPNFNIDYYTSKVEDWPTNISFAENGSWPTLIKSKAAIVCSGTATLETALFDVPQVVMYKSSPISMTIARWFVTIKYISLVNLIVDKPLVKELIQEDATAERLTNELNQLLHQNPKDFYQDLNKVLYSHQVMDKVITFLKKAISF